MLRSEVVEMILLTPAVYKGILSGIVFRETLSFSLCGRVLNVDVVAFVCSFDTRRSFRNSRSLVFHPRHPFNEPLTSSTHG